MPGISQGMPGVRMLDGYPSIMVNPMLHEYGSFLIRRVLSDMRGMIISDGYHLRLAQYE